MKTRYEPESLGRRRIRHVAGHVAMLAPLVIWIYALAFYISPSLWSHSSSSAFDTILGLWGITSLFFLSWLVLLLKGWPRK